jgi:hypothetical protein
LRDECRFTHFVPLKLGAPCQLNSKLEKASVLSLAGRPEFREAEVHLAKKKGPQRGGLKALRGGLCLGALSTME